ncbi:hypothetical protein M9H77_24750 [Catharanthus roseus]|uniref:Uncharacterized protein n=1 Tax=Catharanthus roseus TaxID=4058 RepID=A0ACC0A672_CATRO|nr:hypothetical protein M9H77_24750 [Catharanthus roseus]
MEVILQQYSSQDHQSISPYRSQNRTPKKKPINNQSLISRRPSENLGFQNGIIQAPPFLPLSHSYPPFPVQKQPPLLPLPVISRGLSCPPLMNNRKASAINNNGKKSPRNSKPKVITSPRKDEILKNVNIGTSPISNGVQLGPDPKDLPKNGTKILTLSSGSEFSGRSVEEGYTISPPPPSSLPLPTFSLRPKLSCSCKAEMAAAAGIDTGATDNLRRLLRLP